MDNNFYRAFEEKFRCSRELIKSRLQVYLPFVVPLLDLHEKATAIDLGCGRGEWLELLDEAGFQTYGVDLDSGMLAACHDRGLNVDTKDAIEALKELPDASQVVVSGFHIVEHLPFSQLQVLVQEALRVLKPAGMLIMETPNPENIVVGTSNFYLDPTHERPIPKQLLSFLPEYYGYGRVKILLLQEPPHIATNPQLELMDVFGGVSPDYAVVAQKSAHPEMMAATAAPFEKDYGSNFETLADRYHQTIANSISRAETTAQSAENQARQAEFTAQSAENRAQQAETAAQSAENRAQQAESVAHQMQESIVSLTNSISWKITKPLRATKRMARNVISSLNGAVAAVKMKVKNFLHRVAAALIRKIWQRPEISGRLKLFIRKFPRFRERLRRVAVNSGAISYSGMMQDQGTHNFISSYRSRQADILQSDQDNQTAENIDVFAHFSPTAIESVKNRIDFARSRK
jgi:SAM-dependent methyltransferase